MKKCISCGAEMVDEALFCPKCGAKCEANQQAEVPSEEKKAEEPSKEVTDNKVEVSEGEKKVNSKTVGMIACAVAVIVLLVIIIAFSKLFCSPKATVNRYFKAFEKGDVKTIMALTVPKDIAKDYFDEVYDESYSDVIDHLKPVYSAMWKDLKGVGKIDYTYTVKDVTSFADLSKSKRSNYSFDDLDEFKEIYEDRFEDYGFNADKISKLYLIKYSAKLKAGKEKIISVSDEVLVYKYKGKYYITNRFLDYRTVLRCLYSIDDDVEDFEDAVSDFNEWLGTNGFY